MSEENRGMRLRLGAFVILALVLLGAMIVMFGSLPGLFKRTTRYTVRFVDAPGLAPGAPVRRSGVRIGEVSDITLDEDLGVVRVTILINAPYQPRRSEQATLVTGLLGTDASIDFVPKAVVDGEPPDREPYEPGSELVGVRAPTVNTLLRGATEVVPNTQETLNEIRKSIQRLERFVARAERTIPLAEETLREYRSLAREARAAVPGLRRAGDEVRELARAYREAVPDALRAIEEYRQLGREARSALPEFMKTNREIQEAVRSARELVPQAEQAVAEFRELMRDVRKLSNDLDRLVPVVRNNIEDIGAAAREARKFTENADTVLRENREELKLALQRLSRTAEQVLKLLNDENLEKFNRALTNITTASDRLPAITRNVEDVSGQARTTVRQLNETLKKLDESLSDVRRLTGPLGERAGPLSRNLDEAAANLNVILKDVRALLRALDSRDGTLQRLLKDPSIYNNIDRAIFTVTKMLPSVARILKDAEVLVDKLARHPELLGVRGAINGSTGLKGPATPPLMPR